MIPVEATPSYTWTTPPSYISHAHFQNPSTVQYGYEKLAQVLYNVNPMLDQGLASVVGDEPNINPALEFLWKDVSYILGVKKHIKLLAQVSPKLA